MITITAVIRVKPGTESIMWEALQKVAANVRENEPKTIGFFIAQSTADPNVFTTYERFVDREAMEAHNAAAIVKELHRLAQPILAEPVILEIGEERFAKS